MNDLNEKQLDRFYRYLTANPEHIILAAFMITPDGLIISGPDAVIDLIVELTGDITIKEAIHGRSL